MRRAFIHNPQKPITKCGYPVQEAIESIVITSEEDALEWLQKLVEGTEGLTTATKLDLQGWPSVVLRLEGEKYQGTITPTVMHGMIDLQRQINRAYAVARYDSTNLRQLTAEERAEIELVVKVEAGSSNYRIDVNGLLEKFITTAGGRMESAHLMTTILGFSLMAFSYVGFKLYLNHRAKVRARELDSEERIRALEQVEKLSAEETKRTQLLASLVGQSRELQMLEPAAFDAQTAMLRTAVDAESRSATTPIPNWQLPPARLIAHCWQKWRAAKKLASKFRGSCK